MSINKNIRILYVEDDLTIKEPVDKTVGKLYPFYFSCEDGEEAIDILSKEHIDIIVTDMNMPTKSGACIIQHMLCDNNDVHFRPTIITSGQYHISEKYKDQECIVVLDKPFDISVLVQEIENTYSNMKDKCRAISIRNDLAKANVVGLELLKALKKRKEDTIVEIKENK